MATLALTGFLTLFQFLVPPTGFRFRPSHFRDSLPVIYVSKAIAKACIRSYSLLQPQDPQAARITRLLESGMSKEDAWKLLVMEILVNTGLIVPEQLNPSPASVRTESVQIPIFEAKLVKVIRIEPEEDNRIRAVLSHAREDTAAAKGDVPTESSVIRQAIRLGLDELEKQRSQALRRE